MEKVAETTEPPGRREQNKIDTRKAIADAALALARRDGPGSFTVDQIAASAGVSRRTFFNYFHSAEEALNIRMESFLELAIGIFAEQPAGLPLLDTMIAAFGATTQVQNLGTHGELFRMAADNPELLRAQLHSWERAETRIVQAVQERLGSGVSHLYVTALVGSVLSCTKAAMQDWAGETPEPDDASGADLEARIVRALSLLREGFAHPA
ncbi:TetR/AcrR family transcriptional regulator [Arthrobacter sp. H41]|uniref:TetR/AcrR family transcriptional regulator n=1 Tax=Arthrobacter sp. H41 TaxID=1312978 RepID=UPI0004799D02|nr:TetR/AcrR family transcriptional regulator [Arthrobacter sp. H41]